MSSKKCVVIAFLWAVIILTGFPVGSAAVESSVKVWEEPLTLPTYRVGEPDPNPMFFYGRRHQGAKGMVYPYPLQDDLIDIRENKTY